MVFSSGATTVATRSCDAEDMGYGDALISWNGKDSGGHQVTGPVTWTLTAGDGDGAAPTRTGTIDIAR